MAMNSGSIPANPANPFDAASRTTRLSAWRGHRLYGASSHHRSANIHAQVRSQGQMTRVSRSGTGIWSASAGVSSGTNETECTANCGPLPMHRFSKSLSGTGLVFGTPSRSIQHESTYRTPASASFACASRTRAMSGSAWAMFDGVAFIGCLPPPCCG